MPDTASVPSAQHSTLLITTLAEYQTDFWLEVGRALRQRAIPCAFVSFDDRSTEMLRADGFRAWSASEVPAEVGRVTAEQALRTLADHGIDAPNFWLSHERYTFAQRDSTALTGKMLRYLRLVTTAIDALQAAGERVVLVQELGGFVSVVASFFAARRAGVRNWFIEPSFFRGRLFFLPDTFAAPRMPREPAAAATAPVREYIDRTIAQQAIAIPIKDKHHYTSALRKIANLRNARRLVEKIADKHLFGKHQEFGHIGHHVRTHARMLLNGLRLRSRYTPLSGAGRFVYYPLHVPADVALTLRSPQYVDQLALIEYLLRTIPATHRLAIKEHPAMIGAVDARRVLELMNRFDNLVLLPPSTNNFDVLRACDLVVSVNSKSGAEATLLDKPVLVLGDAFYRDSPLVTAVAELSALPEAIRTALGGAPGVGGADTAARWFQRVWDASLPGELYVVGRDNVVAFTDSMLAALAEPATVS